MSRLSKRLATFMTFVRFLSTVNSVVCNKLTWCCKSFATNRTFKLNFSIAFQFTGLPPCISRLCRCNWLDSLKRLSHSEHLYGFSPVWTFMWSIKCPDWLNAFSHSWHLYGFSPLWILLCLTSWPGAANRLLQTGHSNSFSPEWLRLCWSRCLLL